MAVKDGGGDGHDRLLGAAPGFDAVELGLQVLAIPSFFEIKESGEVRNRSEKNRI